MIQISEKEYLEALNFSISSSVGQRETFGSQGRMRSIDEIRQNTLLGKVGEIIVFNFFRDKLKIKIDSIDFNIYPRGKWDNGDLSINGKSIQIKASKISAKWLMVEKHEFDSTDCRVYFMVVVASDFRSGEILGFASRKDFKNPHRSMHVKKGETIPRTKTILQNDNYMIHKDKLRNSLDDFDKLKQYLLSEFQGISH